MPALTPEQEMLKQAALAATPGKWSWWTSNSYLRLSSERGGDGDILHGARLSDGCCTVDISEANRTFIERANPAAILALLARLEAAQAVPSVTAQAGINQQASAGPDFADRPLDRLIAAAPLPIFDMTKHVAVTVSNKTGPLPSTPLPGSGLQSGEQDDDVKESGRGGRYVPVAVRDALREEVIDLHRQLAAEKLRADQGWARYEAANRSRQATENQLPAIIQPVQVVPDGPLLRVRDAIEGYYKALDAREHGGAAQDRAWWAVQAAMGMDWNDWRAAKSALPGESGQ